MQHPLPLWTYKIKRSKHIESSCGSVREPIRSKALACHLGWAPHSSRQGYQLWLPSHAKELYTQTACYQDCLDPRSHKIERENWLLQFVLWPSHTCCGIFILYTNIHKEIKDCHANRIFFSWDRVLCSLGLPQTCNVASPTLNSYPPASIPRMLGLQVCANLPPLCSTGVKCRASSMLGKRFTNSAVSQVLWL